MEIAKREKSLSIGDVDYTFVLEFWYWPGNSAIDPAEQEEAQLVTWDFDGPIEAWNNKTDTGYQVSDPFEIEYIKGNISPDDEFHWAIS